MKIYTVNDRIKIKIHDDIVYISPLSLNQKAEVQACFSKYSETNDKKDLIMASFRAIKYSLKAIESAEHYEGDEYNFCFEEYIDNYLPEPIILKVLTDKCVTELFNTYITNELSVTALSLLNSIPKEIINPMTSKPLEGVIIINPIKEKRKK
jgi:hypothetical protein